MTFEGVPGVVETKEAHGETTLVVDPARLLEACAYLRDEQGFNFLSDVSAADYLGWGGAGRRLPFVERDATPAPESRARQTWIRATKCAQLFRNCNSPLRKSALKGKRA